MDHKPKGGDSTIPNFKKKVKRGFGLHNWMQLLRVAKDPAQLNGQSPSRYITKEEVSLHNTEHDVWVILNKKVYNLTPYLHYHPGGIEIMESGYGGDITELFYKYHTWVNIDGLIGKLQIGSLAVEQTLDTMEE